MRGRPTCVVCGTVPVGRAEISMQGEYTCTRHEVAGRCFLCTRPLVGPVVAPWRTLAPGTLRCPTCSVGALDGQADVRSHLPPIRAELSKLGFVMRERVKVDLVTSDRLSHALGTERAGALGVTSMRLTGARTGSDLRIEVLRGLTPLHFGRTVSHEAGHAWLAQVGARAVALEVEEGFCELVAYAWLRRREGTLASALRRSIRENRDPVYGDGFRLVYEATSKHGINAVVGSLGRRGLLPS